MKTSPKVVLFLILFLCSGILIAYFIDKTIENAELEKRKLLIQKENLKATAHFQKGIEKFSLLVSGIRSYIETKAELPPKKELQSFLKGQLHNFDFEDAFIISFIDTNHIFKYSITTTSVSPNNLEGVSLKSIRDSAKIARLDNLLTSDELMIFPPSNLVEGFVGIPMSFRTVRNGETQGYYSPILNFKVIIDDFYDKDLSEDFVFHFSTVDGLDFDRAAVYDGSKVYNLDRDTESFKNFGIPRSAFTYNTFSSFGYNFKIGTAHKHPYSRNIYSTVIVINFLLIIIILTIAGFVYWKLQTKKNQLLNSKNIELTASSEALKNFVYASSHDLKEPLRTIGSFSSLIKKRYENKLDDRGQQYLDFIIEGVHKMNSLMADLLQYTTLANKKNLSKEKVDLNQIVNNTEHALKTTIAERNASLVVDDLPTLNINPALMQQLFQNLISNGIKFNAQTKPIIRIGARKKNTHYAFFVKDNGIGISKEYHGKVFEVFQRLSANVKGSGIGLALCKKIVEQHNGKLWVDSKKGEGSTFYFTLPNPN